MHRKKRLRDCPRDQCAETPDAEEDAEALLPGCAIEQNRAYEREQAHQGERGVPDEGRRREDDAWSAAHQPTMTGCPEVAEIIVLYAVVGILCFGDNDQEHPLCRCNKGQCARGLERPIDVRHEVQSIPSSQLRRSLSFQARPPLRGGFYNLVLLC